MSEFRRDPFLGHWRLFAEGRSARPNEYAVPPVAAGSAEGCPFCPGRESQTPSELAAVRPPDSPPNRPGWTVRSIPNRFPTLEPTARGSASPPGAFFERSPGVGTHEVIVASPFHGTALAFLPGDAQLALFRFFRDRVRVAEDRAGVRTTILLENKGPESGGTLPHPHAQLLASETVPDRVREESDALRRSRPGCGLERVLEHERAAGERIVEETDSFLVFAPFASEHPLELWIVPRRHRPSLAAARDAEVDALAGVLPRALRALEATRPGASYNWFVHGRSGSGTDVDAFHWHVELTPRLHRADGFELAAGIPVNSILPEQAAVEYRRAIGREAEPGRKR
jgi:UDPglucose--hexose-1-phosphate uridylyltransferase